MIPHFSLEATKLQKNNVVFLYNSGLVKCLIVKIGSNPLNQCQSKDV